jgi:hypothetical protein
MHHPSSEHDKMPNEVPRRRNHLFLLLCILSSLLAAASTGWAAGADRSTPKAAADAIYQAIQNADESAIEQSLYAQTEEQKNLAHALAHLMASGRRFQLAAGKRFGAAAESLVADMTAGDELKEIDKASVKQTADRAELLLGDTARPITFIRSDGIWRLDIIDYAGAQPGRIKKQIQLLGRVSVILNDTTAEIAAGKYDSPQAVRKGMEKMLTEVMTP